MNSRQRKKLFRFLKEAGVYNAYHIAFVNYNKNMGIDEKFSKMDGFEPINSSFCWAGTEQGHEFWSFLNDFHTSNINGINIMNVPYIMQTYFEKDYFDKLCNKQ